MDGSFRVQRAVVGTGERRSVIVDRSGTLHIASEWLAGLADIGTRPNTIRAYGSRVAAYLTYTAATSDWLTVKMAHLHMWRRALAVPYLDRRGRIRTRSESTIDAWLVPVRQMYEWAEAQGILRSRLAELMTEARYFAPGTDPGGEFGRHSRVLARELRSARPRRADQRLWVSDPGARQRILDDQMRPRDRFLVDLLYLTGIRIGEALTLRTDDLHFGGAPESSGCRRMDPHFHVGENNGDDDGPSAKGRRVLPASERLIDSYVDYAIERVRVLGDEDPVREVFVALYATATAKGVPLGYGGARNIVIKLGHEIGFPINGPHMLRHTLATRLIRGHESEKVAEDVVQAILGHASIASTRAYTHDIESLMQAALAESPARAMTLGSPA